MVAVSRRTPCESVIRTLMGVAVPTTFNGFSTAMSGACDRRNRMRNGVISSTETMGRTYFTAVENKPQANTAPRPISASGLQQMNRCIQMCSNFYTLQRGSTTSDMVTLLDSLVNRQSAALAKKVLVTECRDGGLTNGRRTSKRCRRNCKTLVLSGAPGSDVARVRYLSLPTLPSCIHGSVGKQGRSSGASRSDHAGRRSGHAGIHGKDGLSQSQLNSHFAWVTGAYNSNRRSCVNGLFLVPA